MNPLIEPLFELHEKLVEGQVGVEYMMKLRKEKTKILGKH
jgi:hypothetical protein